MLRLSNLDVANTLLVLMQGDRNIPIRCVVADLAFENGVMRPRQFVFDTAHTTLVGEGKANFAHETLDLRLVAKPKSNSLLALRGPINVSGTFAKPSVMPDLEDWPRVQAEPSRWRGRDTACRDRAVPPDRSQSGRAVRSPHPAGEAIDRAA